MKTTLIAFLITLGISVQTVAAQLIDSVEVKPKMAITLFWICKDKTDQPYIYPGENPEKLKSDLLDKAANWTKMNPSWDILVKYDGIQLSSTAVPATQRIIDEDYKEETPNIKLGDLRNLQVVRTYPSGFHPKLPIYFRVDLSREATAHELLSTKVYEIIACADLDMDAIDCGRLIEENRKEFDEYGILMAKGKYMHEDGYVPYFENGFQIMGNNPDLLRALETTIIKPGIARGQWIASLWEEKSSAEQSIYHPEPIIQDWELFLKVTGQDLARVKNALLNSFIEESVYNSHWQVFFELHHLKKHITLVIEDVEEICDFIIRIFKITPNHIHFFSNLDYAVATLCPGFEGLLLNRGDQDDCLYVPVVDVPIPPS